MSVSEQDMLLSSRDVWGITPFSDFIFFKASTWLRRSLATKDRLAIESIEVVCSLACHINTQFRQPSSNGCCTAHSQQMCQGIEHQPDGQAGSAW